MAQGDHAQILVEVVVDALSKRNEEAIGELVGFHPEIRGAHPDARIAEDIEAAGRESIGFLVGRQIRTGRAHHTEIQKRGSGALPLLRGKRLVLNPYLHVQDGEQTPDEGRITHILFEFLHGEEVDEEMTVRIVTGGTQVDLQLGGPALERLRTAFALLLGEDAGQRQGSQPSGGFHPEQGATASNK